ncbi:MAG: hypothetical protein EBT06_12330 [Gammaproteobacteria bacterium]|nr:hypothetical protein [Gammaproteobacteria bacterium]NBT45674.1 hypothetical protein [Gammaproteobacteria bacterium]NBY21619.1 hypothetical protein [Gammaproteobacteria bacterium]NDG88915.1 hypothetical protein [Gammaproteobacteria bacterium]
MKRSGQGFGMPVSSKIDYRFKGLGGSTPDHKPFQRKLPYHLNPRNIHFFAATDFEYIAFV